jgi:hypothetical protein
MADKLAVTTILVRQGQAQENASPFIVSFQGRGSHSGVRFHVLAETPAADQEPLCQRLLATFQRSVTGEGRVSLTTAMGNALQESHRELLSSNRAASLATQVGASITCLALRDSDIYIARGGPGALYLRDAHGVRTINPLSTGEAADSQAQGSQSQAMLGLADAAVPVMLERQTLEPEQVLLAAYTSLVKAVSYDGLVTILSSSPAEAADKLHLLMQEGPVFAALLVTPTK